VDRTLDEELTSADFLRDPYPTYRRLREESPIHWVEPWHVWVISRYHDIWGNLHNWKVFGSEGRTLPLLRSLSVEVRQEIDDIYDVYTGSALLNADPPTHSQLRTLLTPAFTKQRMLDRAPRFEQLADMLIDRVAAGGEMDLIRDFADPFPAMVAADILGLPVEEWHRYAEWGVAMTRFVSTGKPTGEQARRLRAAMIDARQCILDAVDRQDSSEPGVTQLLKQAWERGEITEHDMVRNIISMAVAGHESTAGLIGAGLLELWRRPDAWRRISELARADDALSSEPLEIAVEELLRFITPFQRYLRIIGQDVELHGCNLRKGDCVLFLLASGDRDERQFENPDELVLHRQPNKHLAFGHGIHFCIGAPLSRLEIPIAFAALFRRLRNIRLDERQMEHIEWRKDVVRCPTSLKVYFDA